MKNKVFEPLYGVSQQGSPEEIWEPPVQQTPAPVNLPVSTNLGFWNLDNQKLWLVALAVLILVALVIIWKNKKSNRKKKKAKKHV